MSLILRRGLRNLTRECSVNVEAKELEEQISENFKDIGGELNMEDKANLKDNVEEIDIVQEL